MTQSFNQAFEQIRSAIPNGCEAVVMYRRKLHAGAAEQEIAFAFHNNAKVANVFFDIAEKLARTGKHDVTAAVVFGRWPEQPRAWFVIDAFDLDPVH